MLVRFLEFYRYCGVGVRVAFMLSGVLLGWGVGVWGLFFVAGYWGVSGVGYDFVRKRKFAVGVFPLEV